MSYSSITHEQANCSLIYIVMLICCVAQVLFISETAKCWLIKLRKTWTLSSGMCAGLVAEIFFVFASPAGAQKCPSGATGCSGPVSNWDTSKVTSTRMMHRKSKYLTYESCTFVYSYIVHHAKYSTCQLQLSTASSLS